MTRGLLAALAVAAVVGMVGCGSDDEGSDAAPAASSEVATEASRCSPVPRPALASIEDTLRGNRTLGESAAVESSDSFGPFPRGIAKDAWFVTADVMPNPGLSTWILSDDAFRTGGGIIIGADAAARAASIAGGDVDLEAIAVDESSDGLAESVACVGVE